MLSFSFTPAARRQYETLVRRNHVLQFQIEQMIATIREDPFNQTHQFDIRKLTDFPAGQWRVRKGDYRIRYDVDKNRLIIHAVFDRKEGY
ncbi:type II toxin-antitoxin system RelE/ParE family toxin [Candidatus Berkelbacteria bacterium]|nr:type II toxin-antitoxin system RelE/ParE family toxin [Candidatus Berkelbacteria bacterium]